jgi:hypothetical protein
MQRVSNGMKFARWQFPLKLIYPATVDRSQRMTLNKTVIDLRSQFWEHRQLYVALSRVRHPENLFILLPESCEPTSRGDPTAVPLRIPVDRKVVNVVSAIAGRPSGGPGSSLSVPSTRPITTESPIDNFSCEPGGQVDHETDKSSWSPSHGPELLWSDGETDDAHESCIGPTTELDLHFPIDDTTAGEIAMPQISSDPSIEFDAPLPTN